MGRQILLITVAGNDKPGLMAMVTSTLREYQVDVLDVGQAIIHDQLALGLLVALDAPLLAPVQERLHEAARDMGTQLRTEPVSDARYAEWSADSGKPRYILTLLAGGDFTGALHAVSTTTHQAGLNVDTVRRLSDRPNLESITQGPRTVIEARIRGEVDSTRVLQQLLMEAADEQGFDFSLQKDTVFRRNRRLVAFDMDSTLISAEVIDELAELHGVGDAVRKITERSMRGELDFKASFRERAKLLAGLPVSALDQVANQVRLNPGAERLLHALQTFGYSTALISGGFQHVGEHLARRFGINYVFANTLDVQDGVMTGEVTGEIVDAERKATLLAQIAEQEGITLNQTIAIGDGANDLPMLSAAGLGVAYHAKPVVKATAGHAISNFGLDAVLYLIGFSDRDLAQLKSD